MKHFKLISAGMAAITLAACGQSNSPEPRTQSAEPAATMDMAEPGMMDHSGHDMGSGDTGHATGIVKSVGAQGDFMTIDHGPIEGIGMGAMTMGFDIAGDVDLTEFKDGDAVSFMVKKGRDGSYRITAICDTAKSGEDCLSGMMDHSGHE